MLENRAMQLPSTESQKKSHNVYDFAQIQDSRAWLETEVGAGGSRPSAPPGPLTC